MDVLFSTTCRSKCSGSLPLGSEKVLISQWWYLVSVSPTQSLVFDSVKHSTDPLPSGAVGMAASGECDAVGAVGNTGMLPFQVEFIKNLIDESLDEFRYETLSSGQPGRLTALGEFRCLNSLIWIPLCYSSTSPLKTWLMNHWMNLGMKHSVQVSPVD